MRYMTTAKLQKDMVLGQDIYDGCGNLLFPKGMALIYENIQKLQSLGCPGVYLEDALGKGVAMPMAVSAELRRRALELVSGLFQDERQPDISQEQIQGLAQDLVEELRGHKNPLYNMRDIKTYGDYTYFHSVNVAVISVILGMSCDLEPEGLVELALAALLHDIGKRYVEPEVLSAKRMLTDEERVLIVQHPKLGYEFLQKHYHFSQEVCINVLEHHEWYNGCGYPMRKSGAEIPLYARIVKLADVYDAMTSKLPYHEPIPPSAAAEYILDSAGAEFDPALVDIFKQKVALYPAGCEVLLSDGSLAIVMENFGDAMQTPRVKVISSGELLDLRSKNAGGLVILE